eukprot:TRINITY_DN63225_c0_g1_i1.p1 TRINITY_DN63225_c0_g1~~TRINITY_DN63225_c0_g1_i1.p1  ORF type:complete len:824 (+),score=108.28 TRINITY_DN63225_c0_g1_i1:56-2527(+)
MALDISDQQPDTSPAVALPLLHADNGARDRRASLVRDVRFALQIDGAAGLGSESSGIAAGRPLLGLDSSRVSRSLPSRCVDVVFPWLLALLVGMVTAATGIFIAMNCDFLTDIRFGRCRGYMLMDRNRCCGGADNIDHATERCIHPSTAMMAVNGSLLTQPDWVPWEEAGTSAAFLVYLSISLMLAGVTAYVVYSYEPCAKGSGIPDVKASVSGFAVTRSFSATCLVLKSLGLSMVVGAGLALGKEGPLIQIGVCWAYVLRSGGGPFKVLAGAVPLYELVCVGAAAGVSTAFGAPVGGVLFAVEELGSVRALSQRALLLAFAGSFTASFVLKSFNLYGSNQLTFFVLSTTNSNAKEWVAWQCFIFVLLGCLGGLVGSLFIRCNLWAAKRRKRLVERGRLWFLPESAQVFVLLQLPCGLGSNLDGSVRLAPSALHVIEVMCIALVSCALNYPVTALLRKPMVEVIHGLFETCPNSLGVGLGLCSNSQHGFAVGFQPEAMLLFAATVRFLQTVVTFGSMIPSGLFIPSLYIGAVLGRLVGLWTLRLDVEREAEINPSLFAMVGALAVLGGFARMTVSLVVIMIELTGELNYAIPFMCAVLTAKLVGDSFTVSIYDGTAGLLGYATIEEPANLRLAAQVSDVASPCRSDDVLDVSRLVSSKAIGDMLLRTTVGPPGKVMRGGMPVEMDREGARGPLHDRDAIVLTRGRSDVDILGVVQKHSLQKFLDTQCGAEDVDVAFHSGAFEEAADDGRVIVDARSLLTLGIRRLRASAPVLTAICAFRDYPDLEYCVCRDELDGETLSLLSRGGLEHALNSGRFAAAFARDA